MAKPQKPTLVYRLSSDDITKIKAKAVVVGEAPLLDKDSLVTQTLMEKIYMFKIRRAEFKASHKSLDLWSVKHSYLGDTFKYVIHAVLDKGDNEIWVEKMKKLYHRIFTEAECLGASSIALPLLGTGAASFDNSLAVRALVASVLSYSPQRRILIIVVSKEKKLLDETETQFQYQHRYPEKKKTIVQKGIMCMRELVEAYPHRDTMQPKFSHEVEVKGKRKNHSGSTDRELKQALKQSALEAEEIEKKEQAQKGSNKNINAVPRHPSSQTNVHGHKNKSFPNNSSSKEDFELQKAIELSKRETCSQATADLTLTLNNGTSLGDEITCPICLCCISDPKQLDKCGHLFCRACIDRSFLEHKPVCPSCNMVYGEIRGNQPDGQMDVGFSGEHLPGFEGHGTITITYRFPNGWQKEEHPSPGQPYKGTTRRAYLPANSEGKEILALLKTAFERRLTFTIGRSTTTGMEGVVTWNDIHHKTNVHGGPTKFGYPDPTYLSRVRDELASKGVTKSTGISSSRPRSPTRELRSITLKDLTCSIDYSIVETISHKELPEFSKEIMYKGEVNLSSFVFEESLKKDLTNEDASKNPVPDNNEEPNPDHSDVDSTKDETSEPVEKYTDFQDLDSADQNDTGRRITACVMVSPETGMGHQKQYVSADQHSDKNTKNDSEGSSLSWSVHEPQHLNNTRYTSEDPEPDISGERTLDHSDVDSVKDEKNYTLEKDFQDLPNNGLDSADPSDGVPRITACDIVPSTDIGHQKQHVSAEQDSETDTSVHNQDLKHCIPENIPEKEFEIQEKKSIGLKVDDNSPDEATLNLKLQCTIETIPRGTGYTEAEEIRGHQGEEGLLTCSPRSSSLSSLDTNSNSSDSFVIIDSSVQNEESFMSDDNALHGIDGDVPEEKRDGEKMKELSGDSCTEHVEINNLLYQNDVHVNENDTGHSIEIIDVEKDHYQDGEDQSDNTTTEKSVRLTGPLQRFSEEEHACSLQSLEDSGDRSDRNQDNEHANFNGNSVHDVQSGNQPDGQMDVGFSGEHLPGYEGLGTITITYYFPSGTQGAQHPNPGQSYKGTTRRAYLPDSKEGKDVLKLLRKAFERKLTFTIEPSVANGQECVVSWNDIHHKTNKDGGAERCGYPDSTYLQRVRDELAGKGLTSDSQDETT